MKPFNGYCESTESNFKALGSYGFFRSTSEGQRISPFIKGQVGDDRILEIIKKEHFAYVVLVTRYTAFLTDDESKKEIESFKVLHEHIVRSVNNLFCSCHIQNGSFKSGII